MAYNVGQLIEMRAVLDKHCRTEVAPAFAAQLRRVRRLVGEHVREVQDGPTLAPRCPAPAPG